MERRLHRKDSHPWNAGSLTGDRAEGAYTVQSSGTQANVHLDFSTSGDHPVIVAYVSTSIIAVGGQIGYIYEPKYHTSDGSVNVYGALRGINIGDNSGDSVADFGVKAYYGAGAEVGVRVNLSKLYEEIFHEREDTNKKEDIKRRVNEITDKRRNWVYDSKRHNFEYHSIHCISYSNLLSGIF